MRTKSEIYAEGGRRVRITKYLTEGSCLNDPTHSGIGPYVRCTTDTNGDWLKWEKCVECNDYTRLIKRTVFTELD